MPIPLPAVLSRRIIYLLGLPALALAQPAFAQPLTEAEAIARALGDVDASNRDRAVREAARAAARAVPLFENPDVSATHSRIKGAAAEEREREAIVTQPIDVSGRRLSLRSAAHSEADAVDADVQRRLQERVADVRRAYVSCAVAFETAGLSTTFAKQLRAAERVTAERTAAGDTAAYDLRRLRVEVRSAEAQASLSEGEATAECATLANLTGVAGPRPATPLAGFRARASGAPAPARPDLVALERRASAAQASARAAQRARIPELRVGLGYRELEVLGASADGPVVSLGVTVPLFSTGGAQARQARAEAQVQAADLALARRRAQTEVAAAGARLQAASHALTAARATSDDAARLGTIAETAYRAGEVGITELVDAYRAAHDAEKSIVELTGRTIKAAIDLDLAQGAPVP